MDINKLKGKIREKSKTYEECSKSIGVTITTFSNKMNGISKFYVEEINILSKFLGLTNDEKIDIFLN